MQFVNLASEEKVNPLIPHTAELIVGAVAFTLLFLVLRKFVVKKHSPPELKRFKVASSVQRRRKLKHNVHLLSTPSSYLRRSQKHRLFVKKLVFKVQQSLKIFVPRHKKKQLALQQLLMLQSKQNVNKQLHHFATKLVR
jgi:hypothetical protein